jgi:hypothetical protein
VFESKDDRIAAIIIGVVALIIGCFLGLAIMKDIWVQDAIKSGAGEYVSDKYGTLTWKWNVQPEGADNGSKKAKGP